MTHSIKCQEVILSDLELVPEILQPGLGGLHADSLS